MLSFIFKNLVSFSGLINYTPVLSFVGFGLSLLTPALKSREQAQLSASFTPSRVSGTPTRSFVAQEKPSVIALGFLIFMIIIVSLAAATHQWIRSPGSPRRRGRLHKDDQDPPPPPPPPPPSPQPLASGNDDGQDDDPDSDGANGSGSDDDPQQDGGADGDNGTPDGDGLMVGAAPAPEDPPPPAGDVEEDGDDDVNYSASDGGLSWLFLLLLGKIISAPFSGTSKVNIEPAIVKPGPVDTSESAAHTLAPVARRGSLLPSWAKTYFQLTIFPCFVFAIAVIRLLVDLPPPLRSQGQEQEQEPEQEVVRQPEQEVVAEPVQEPAPEPEDREAPDPQPDPQDHALELPPEVQEEAHEPLPDPQHEAPEPPPPAPHQPARAPDPTPEWQAARERIRLALFQHAPGPARAEDQAARTQAVNILQRTAARRAAQPAVHEDDAERKRRAEVRKVQRRVWGLMCELALRGADEIEEDDG